MSWLSRYRVRRSLEQASFDARRLHRIAIEDADVVREELPLGIELDTVTHRTTESEWSGGSHTEHRILLDGEWVSGIVYHGDRLIRTNDARREQLLHAHRAGLRAARQRVDRRLARRRRHEFRAALARKRDERRARARQLDALAAR